MRQGEHVELITFIGVLVGLVIGLHQLWVHILAPRTKRYKLNVAYDLIQQWFDLIDTSLESGVDQSRLQNLEARIDRYIEDHSLSYYQLKFTLAFQHRFLMYCGIRPEFHSPEMFEKYARAPVSGIDLQSYWRLLVSAFSTFHRKYGAEESGANFSDIEMRVKLLRIYLGVKEKK
jgi:hypothetical protein